MSGHDSIAALGTLSVDPSREPSGVGAAIRSGEVVFVPDACTSPVPSKRLVGSEAPIDEASWEKAMVKLAEAGAVLADAEEVYATVEWTAEALHAATLAVGEAHGLKLGKAQAPIRVAVTGRSVGPPLFESLAVFGRERALERIRAARARL